MLIQSNSDESQTTEALVPMVDLFAVLALVFMIYSTDEIATAKLATESQIQEIVATAEREIVARVEKDSVETINTLVAKAAQDSEAKIRELELKIEEDARARATYADMSLEALLKQREAKTQQLAQEIAELLTLEDSRAAIEYEGLVSDIAYKYDEELEQQKATLQQIRERELAEQEVTSGVCWKQRGDATSRESNKTRRTFRPREETSPWQREYRAARGRARRSVS